LPELLRREGDDFHVLPKQHHGIHGNGDRPAPARALGGEVAMGEFMHPIARGRARDEEEVRCQEEEVGRRVRVTCQQRDAFCTPSIAACARRQQLLDVSALNARLRHSHGHSRLADSRANVVGRRLPD
jgi:hypothetical protein